MFNFLSWLNNTNDFRERCLKDEISKPSPYEIPTQKSEYQELKGKVLFYGNKCSGNAIDLDEHEYVELRDKL